MEPHHLTQAEPLLAKHHKICSWEVLVSQGHVLVNLNYTKIPGPLSGDNVSFAIFLNQINCRISKIVRLSKLKLLDLWPTTDTCDSSCTSNNSTATSNRQTKSLGIFVQAGTSNQLELHNQPLKHNLYENKSWF